MKSGKYIWMLFRQALAMGPENFVQHLHTLRTDMQVETEKLKQERIALEQQINVEKKRTESLNRYSKQMQLIMTHHDLIDETIEAHGISFESSAEIRLEVKKELINKVFKSEHPLLIFAGNWLNAVLVIFCVSLVVGCIAELQEVISIFAWIIVLNLLCIGAYRCLADAKKAQIHQLMTGYLDEKLGKC